MSISPYDSVRVTPYQQRQFAVCLQSEDAVKDTNSGVFKLASPADIRVFIESRHQLNDDRHLFALSRLGQSGEDGRVLAGPVQRLLHRDHARILRTRFDKFLDRFVGIERVMQHHVVLAQLVENIGRFGARFEVLRDECRILQLRFLYLRVKIH